MKENLLLPIALQRIRNYVSEARQRNEVDAHAASLATAGLDARPSVRTVYLIDISDCALYIATRTDSGKAAQMMENPAVSLCLTWPSLHRQVTLEGNAERCSDDLADELWRKRPREDQLAAWASENNPAGAGAAFKEALSEARKRFDFASVPRPENWGGFRINPVQICDWPTGWHRSRQRKRIKLGDSGIWTEDKLNA